MYTDAAPLAEKWWKESYKIDRLLPDTYLNDSRVIITFDNTRSNF